MKLRHLDLFSGIGGFSLGLEATGGFETVAFCEIEEFPRQVLQKHWPHVKQYKDIKELTYDKLKADGLGSIDIITGGYPCQPFSQAGRKKGEQDPRHLWPEYFRLIKECRPSFVIGENVSGHLKLGLDSVLADLESEGYHTRTFSISAASIGANHKRERVWIVANANGSGNQPEKSGSSRKKNEKETGNRQDDSSSWFPDGTDSTVTQQGSETQMESMENTRRTLRQGTFIREKNEIETEKENADLAQRPGEASKSHVANTLKGNVEAGRERQREIREGHQEEGFLGNASSGGEAVAYANSDREKRNQSQDRKGSRFKQDSSNMANTKRVYAQGQYDGQGQRQPWGESWWAVEPDVGRVAHGIPHRVDRLKALGNSLVPHIPYYIALSILEALDA